MRPLCCLSLPLLAACAACGPVPGELAGATGSAAQPITVGTNESSLVLPDGSNVPPALAPLLDAVGRMEGIACTAAHIGHNLVLTAAHCLMVDALDDCGDVAVEWGVRGSESTGIVGRCLNIRFAELSPERDLALLEVDSAPAAHFELDVCRARGPGDSVLLAGHPERTPLHWSGRCMLEASAEPLGSGRSAHVCDTETGSSGSPLLDWNSLQLLGVHAGVAGTINQASLLYTVPEPFALEGWDCDCDAP